MVDSGSARLAGCPLEPYPARRHTVRRRRLCPQRQRNCYGAQVRRGVACDLTRCAYNGDWRRFSAWCQARGALVLPTSPALVVVFLSALVAAGKTPPVIGWA